MNRHAWHHFCLDPTEPCVIVSRILLVIFSIAFQKFLRLLVNCQTRLNTEDEKGFNSINLILKLLFVFGFVFGGVVFFSFFF